MQYLQILVETTAVEVAGFALMDNHLRLLLRVDLEQAEKWSVPEVVNRWIKLHPVRNGYFEPIETPDRFIEQFAEDPQWVKATRQKLTSISQFMKELKQRIAQVANQRRICHRSLLGGRFKISAVRDEVQLLVTFAYIDLNLFAANACEKP